jgi:chromosome segregation ATPase
MSKDKETTDELSIEEGQDGSAVVDLPEEIGGVDSTEEVVEAKPEEKAEKADLDDDADHPDDGEELRAAKRNRRRAKKELIRKTNEEKDLRLQQLARENEEFKRRLASVENESKQSRISRMDKDIEDQQVRLEYAKMKLAEAATNSDGEAMVEAQTLWRQAEDALNGLKYKKQQAEQELRQPQRQQQEYQAPDPAIQRNAAEWMKRNSWYDPNSNDRDALIAKKHDEAMVTEGWDPKDPDYWDELDSRLQKAMPHRYTTNTDSNSAVRKPRNVVGSSGREASAAFGGTNRNQFILSPERVKAMKEAGAWDNPARKKAMIESFVKYDRANGNRN